MNDADPAAGAPRDPEARRPSMAERLAVPPEGAAPPQGRPGASRSEPPGPPMPHQPDPRRAPILRQVEWFFAALPRLGRTYRQAKTSARAVEDAGRRLAGLESDLRQEMPRLDEAFRRLDDVGDVAGRLDEAHRRLDDVAGRLDDMAGLLDGALRRIGALEEDAGAQASVEALRGQVETRATAVEERLDALSDRIAALAGRGAEERALAARAVSDLGRRLDILRHGPVPAPASAPPEQGLEALLDAFYNRLEARFRGSREEIMRRLVKYLPDVEAAVERTGGRVLDLGCGRGEWLELLRDRGIPAGGVDLNPVQAEEARAAGLDVTEGDALAHLAAQPDGSLAMVSAHHLVEHLPFRTVAALVSGALAKLAPGGLLLLETPNPNSLLVGARSFHMDPTHLRPLPGEVLETLLDTVGFHPVETRHLHPHEKLETFFRERRIDPEIAGLIFGPQDLAVIGTKPALVAPEG